MANKNPLQPFLDTLNGIRSSEVPTGRDVAEALDALVSFSGDLAKQVNGMKSSVTTVTQTVAAQSAAAASKPQTTPNTSSFAAITTGTNIQADMIVSSGAELEYDPTPGATGVVNANEIGTIAVAGNVPAHPGQLLISQPGNTSAIWADPQVQGLYAEGNSIIAPPAYTAPTTIQPVLTGVSASDKLYALRTCDTFKTFRSQGGTPGQQGIWTPTSGKKFRLMKLWISISGDANTTGGGLITIYFTDGVAGPVVGPTFDVNIPTNPTLDVTGVYSGLLFSTDLIDMGNGYLSTGANTTLYLNTSLQLSTGYIRVNTFGTEE